MQTVQASDVATDFDRVLDTVEHGETVLIARNGRTVARMVPEKEPDQKDVDEAIANIREFRKRIKPISLEEILSAKDEGRL